MTYVYFTKSLQNLDVDGLIAFCHDVGLDGVDLTVRPGYPITPDNVATDLPKAAAKFNDAKLKIGLVTIPTSSTDPEARETKAVFETCGKLGIPSIKIGYFSYKEKFGATLEAARNTLAGFARLAARTGVKCCYHSHSGSYLGNNAAGLRLLLQDLDPHAIGVYADTGHLAVNGGPIRMEFDIFRDWLHLIAIKDMAWEKRNGDWKNDVVPAGQGIVRWKEVAQALADTKFSGTISLHAEYEAKDLDERRKLAKAELEFLKKQLEKN
jgi:sugar phosphate isomerase/epimerase